MRYAYLITESRYPELPVGTALVIREYEGKRWRPDVFIRENKWIDHPLVGRYLGPLHGGVRMRAKQLQELLDNQTQQCQTNQKN